MTFIWLFLFIILSLIEICTINLVSIWFALAALSSFVISLVTENIIIQLASFLVVSIIILLATKPLVKKIKTNRIKTNVDQVLGMEALVISDISKFKVGEVKVAGKKWSAKSNMDIKKGEEVIIEKIEGVKLIVRKKSS